MLLIKSKWILDGKQMLNEKVSDEWEEHLKTAKIQYSKIEKISTKKKDIQDVSPKSDSPSA